MPSTSPKQKRFMAACAHDAGYASCPPKKVSTEFNQADKRQNMATNYAKGGDVRKANYAQGGVVLQPSDSRFLKKPSPFVTDKQRSDYAGKGELTKRTGDKCLAPIKPKK